MINYAAIIVVQSLFFLLLIYQHVRDKMLMSPCLYIVRVNDVTSTRIVRVFPGAQKANNLCVTVFFNMAEKLVFDAKCN